MTPMHYHLPHFDSMKDLTQRDFLVAINTKTDVSDASKIR